MDPLIALPTSFAAGTTVKLLRTHSDFPANAGWTLTLRMAGPSVISPLAGSASGANFSFTLTPAITLPLLPGVYRWTEEAAKAGEVYVADSGTVEVLVSLATAGAGDLQSFEEKMLVAIEARIAGRNLGDLPQTYQVASRMAQMVEEKDLWKKREELREAVNLQKNPGTFVREVRVTFPGLGAES